MISKKKAFFTIGFFVILTMGLGSLVSAQSKDLQYGSALILPQPAGGAKESGLTKPGDEISRWKARWELARLLSYSKEYQESIVEYRKLLKEKPDLWEARGEMARVLFWSNQKKEALLQLEKIPQDQVQAELLLLKADLLTADKKYHKAEEIYLSYLQKHPSDLRVRFNLATILSWAGKYKPALKEFRAILEQRPNDIQVRRHYAFVLSWDGQFDESIKQLKMTLKD